MQLKYFKMIDMTVLRERERVAASCNQILLRFLFLITFGQSIKPCCQIKVPVPFQVDKTKVVNVKKVDGMMLTSQSGSLCRRHDIITSRHLIGIKTQMFAPLS